MTQMLTESGVLTQASLTRQWRRQREVWREWERQQARLDCALLWAMVALALLVVAGAFELGKAIVASVGQ